MHRHTRAEKEAALVLVTRGTAANVARGALVSTSSIGALACMSSDGARYALADPER